MPCSLENALSTHTSTHTQKHIQTVLHSCLNYAENVTLIIGIYGVFAALDIIDDEAELRRQCTEKFKSTLWHCSAAAAAAALLLLLLLSFQLASVDDGNSVLVRVCASVCVCCAVY